MDLGEGVLWTGGQKRRDTAGGSSCVDKRRMRCCFPIRKRCDSSQHGRPFCCAGAQVQQQGGTGHRITCPNHPDFLHHIHKPQQHSCRG